MNSGQAYGQITGLVPSAPLSLLWHSLGPGSLISFVHLFNNSLLSTSYVPGLVLSMGDAVVRRNDGPCLQVAHSLVGKPDIKLCHE